MIPNEKNLLLFATKALEILQSHEDWCCNTTDEIGELAIELGLGRANEEGLFEVVE